MLIIFQLTTCLLSQALQELRELGVLKQSITGGGGTLEPEDQLYLLGKAKVSMRLASSAAAAAAVDDDTSCSMCEVSKLIMHTGTLSGQ